MTLKEELSADRRKVLEAKRRKQAKKQEALDKEAEYIINEIIEPTFRKLHYRAREEKVLRIECIHKKNSNIEVCTKPYCRLNSEFRDLNPNLNYDKVWHRVVILSNLKGYESINVTPIITHFKLELDD